MEAYQRNNSFACDSISLHGNSDFHLLLRRSRSDVLADFHRRYFSWLSSNYDHDRSDAQRIRSCPIFSALENNELLQTLSDANDCSFGKENWSKSIDYF